jgi:two-component system nitrate/nitrite response regulator NarL
MSVKRVAVVDDHILFAEAMVVALVHRGYDARCVVPNVEAPTGASLISQVLVGNPDVVLLDLDLGQAGDGLDLIVRLSARAQVVVVTGNSDPVRLGAALAAGAATVISKSYPLEQILDTLTRLRDGLPAMAKEERERLIGRWRQQRQFDREIKARFALLTTREGEVLGELMAGRSARSLAAASSRSRPSVPR